MAEGRDGMCRLCDLEVEWYTLSEEEVQLSIKIQEIDTAQGAEGMGDLFKKYDALYANKMRLLREKISIHLEWEGKSMEEIKEYEDNLGLNGATHGGGTA